MDRLKGIATETRQLTGKMIRRLRKIHRLAWILLAILVPAVFIFGLMYRHQFPLNTEVPQVERLEEPDE